MKHFLEKLQNKSERVRKTILWSIIIILSLFLLFFWFKSFNQKIKDFQKKDINQELKLPDFKEELKTIPKFPEQELKELEKIIEENNGQ
ncbi:hypothetical protein KAS79_02840 [Candidatus Parcubacteria bacterium]|nr:hypothetical protein [Candidatus Parcubacteria bacterium]